MEHRATVDAERIRQTVGPGGLFEIQYRNHDGAEVSLVLQVMGCTYVPGEPPYLVCADRWIPCAAVYAIKGYREAA